MLTRRWTTWIIAALLCAVTCFAQGARTENPYGLPDELMPLWDSLSIRQKAAQLIMVYMSPAEFLVKNEFGGVLVMKSHLNKKDNFIHNLTQANAELRIPLLVASDQEGGRVNRIGGISEKWKHAPAPTKCATWNRTP
jgi:beta-N-acetylhexosaminidase